MNHYEIKFSSEKDIKDILELILERANDTVELKVKKYEPGFLTIKEETLKKPDRFLVCERV